MNDRKIYKMMQKWYPELKSKKIPKKKYRRDYREFYYWMSEIPVEDGYRAYMLNIDRQQHFDNGIENSALFQDQKVNVMEIESRIEARTAPLFKHYEKFKDLIGNFYSIHNHVYDIVLEEIYNEVINQKHRMILIYEMDIVWMAVPDQLDGVEKFIKLFKKQFKKTCPNIEYYVRYPKFSVESLLEFTV